MKTREQIEEMARKYFENDSEAFFDKEEASMYSYQAGYEQAQKDFKEREAKLVDGLKFYADQRSWKTEGSIDDNSFISVIEDDDMYQDKDDAGLFYIGGKRAREVLKELGE